MHVSDLYSHIKLMVYIHEAWIRLHLYKHGITAAYRS
jgi:hypothetical protein